MNDLQPLDKRGYFTLPQTPEEAGYYTYGTPGRGEGQYASAQLLSLIFLVEHRWAGLDDRQFGVGNISLANGTFFEGHKGHMKGLEVDIRPLRSDGKHTAVTRFDKQYDLAGTKKLIAFFWATGKISKIYFNDLHVPRVQHRPRHDDHFHVEVL